MLGSIILLIVLICLNAVFASAEIAVISMNDTKLRKLVSQGNKRAGKLATLTAQPSRFLATIQVAITLAGLLSSAFAAENFAAPLSAWLVGMGVGIPQAAMKSIAVVIITLILAYFNLVFGELVPKRIAMKKSESLALGMAGMLYGVAKVFAPLVWLLTASTNLILRIMGINPDESDEELTEEEIRMILAEGNQQGVIDERENEIIQNVFEFDVMTCSQICTHRVDVIALDDDDTLETWEKTIYETKHTYYPVYRETKDNVLGILDARDYFRIKKKSWQAIFEKGVKPVHYIPEEMKADVLFAKMRAEQNYFAVLIDEYGGMSGIITIQDLIEEIIGDIYEFGNEETREKIKEDQGKWTIYGEAEIQDVAKALNLELPAELYDTVNTFNGFVYEIIGRVPDDGETFSCEGYGLHIQVHNVIRHKIADTTVEIAKKEGLS